jgi:glyceraldehyde-3-phosphate dehydrogenase/erythrose-4-phosphate dehydrogenase
MANIAINGLDRIGRAALKILEHRRCHSRHRPAGHREEINDAFRDEAAGGRYRGILGVAEDPVVSADIIGGPRASVLDAAMTRVVDGILVKVMSWYDNEWGFTGQMIRGAFTALGLPAPDLSQIRP